MPEWCGDRDKDAERPPCNVGDDRSDARSAHAAAIIVSCCYIVFVTNKIFEIKIWRNPVL